MSIPHSLARVRGHEHGLPVLLEHQDQRGCVGGAGRGAVPPTPAGAGGAARPQPAAHLELAHHQSQFLLLLLLRKRKLEQEEDLLLLDRRRRFFRSTEEEGGEGCGGVRAVAARAEAGGDSDAEDQEVRGTVCSSSSRRSRGGLS